jgi:outer membrane protein, adhesin transport system
MHFKARPMVAAVAALAASLISLPASAQSAEAARAAVNKALQNNPDVTSRLNAYLGKIEGQTAAAAGWKPRLDLNAEVGADRSQNRNATAQTVKHSGAGLTLTQVLWDGMATRQEVNRAGHERLSRWFDLVDAAEQTALEATRAVYDVQRLRTLVALAEDNLVQHQQAAAKIDSRFKAGVGRGVDLDQVRARLALAEVNRDTEVSNLHDVAARYQRIIGEPPVPQLGAPELIRKGLPTSADEAARMALANSPAIASSIESLRAARATEAARKSALHPQLSARVNVGGGRNLGGIEGRQTDASVGLQLSWNLYNGGGDTARIREQAQVVNQAMDQRDKACRDTRQTALLAFNDANKLSSQIASLGRNSAAIERAREAYRQQFDIGQRSLLDLLNAENEAYTARRALTNAVYDRAISYARTLAATTQLTVQLGVARDLIPADGANWSAGTDAAGRCPVQAVDIAPLRDGADLIPAVVSPAAGLAQPAPVAMAAPASASAFATSTPTPRASAVPAVNSVENLLQAWVGSWRNRDANALATFYAPGFKGDSASVSAWLQEQRGRMAGRGPMEVSIEDLSVSKQETGMTETRFLQNTTVAGRSVVNHVSLTWAQRDGQWRIVRERRL